MSLERELLMDSPIVTEIVEKMNDLPDNLQQQVLTYIVTLRQAHLQNSASNAWDTVESLTGTIQAPADWSREHDHYLYGTPKQQPTDP
jgi:hypothetical protein